MLEKKCRQCGKDVDFREYGPGRVCPHCGKETATVNITEVHIAFDDSIYSHPDLILSRKDRHLDLGIDYQKICLNYELRVGDISDPPYSNANVYAHKYSSAEVCKNVIDKQLDKLSEVPDHATCYLWLNANDANSYMNMCYFSGFFKRFDSIYLVSCCTEEEMNDESYTLIDSLKNKRLVTFEDLSFMTAEFESDAVRKADYRIGTGRRIEPCTSAWLKSYVLKNVTDDYKNFNLIFSDVHDCIRTDTGNIVGYAVVESVVNELIIEGKIESHGAYMWWGDPAYNNMLCTQSFRLSTPKLTSYTREDVLEIVCDAFEFGHTYPLFDILDDNAVLTFVDSGETFSGKRVIIEFIENDGSMHVNINKEKVSCNIMRIAEGERYGVGECCILLCYEQSNDKKNHNVIKVHFESDKIIKMEIFKAIAPLYLVAEK